ncbi:unnamed protein product [Linum tenue]|uniref:Uncharacterized protein n=1 Tax=Linum tenue TaxID=586396 RepID=A0AAV0PEK9_9ROSI|nr:unnamed protein product [Linum tenue]
MRDGGHQEGVLMWCGHHHRNDCGLGFSSAVEEKMDQYTKSIVGLAFLRTGLISTLTKREVYDQPNVLNLYLSVSSTSEPITRQ